MKFILVGIWNTIFGYGTFFLLDRTFESFFVKRYFAYMAAMILSQIVAIINAFIFHKYVTFSSKVRGWDIIPEFFRFCHIYVFTFLLSLLLLPVFVELINVHPRISGALVTLICSVISYVGHSKFSFKST